MKIVVRKLSDEEKNNLGIYDWPIWTKDISTFNWHYESMEECYIIEGEVEISTEDGTIVHFGADDFVSFPKGLVCTWHVKQAVRKHYRFE